MRWSFYSTRKVAITLSLSLLTLALIGCTGPAAPQGTTGTQSPTAAPAASPAKVSIVTSKTVVDKTVKAFEVYGAGFTPGSSVDVGVYGLQAYANLPGAKDLWFGTVTVNERGAFICTTDLSLNVFNLVTTSRLKEEQLVGVYAIIAENKLGERAFAPLAVVAPPPPKPAAPAPTAPVAPPK